MMSSDHILRVTDLRIAYGRVQVLHGVSLDVPSGALLAIVGPNGAGKSSTLSAIAGGVSGTGDVRFDGQPILGLKPEAIARSGLSFVPEGRHVFGSLSVEENLRIGTFMRGDRQRAERDLQLVLNYFPKLKERIRQAGGKLSGGEQQMLVIGRALMTRPKLILIDEPSLGLAPRIVEEVYAILHRLRSQEGVSILVNEQSSRRVMNFVDEIIVLRDGRVQLKGRPSDLAKSHALHDAYFGTGTFDRDSGEAVH
ncbi:ABC transporter ATP-binding protein [Mesorhizobium sp. M3A.F.Ca.ET.080.04.2.1]|uniref:ABC transporter ATP-binding protein n=1 Tax=Mesorhizobium sp. M3A.F.Ca.ET.080.04.2.1 TaxID=2493676 RepID=UPI001FE153BB|nr:ABC transporter ATP-binding protein [Mesorhizobium sp. M3A.F.Ca.ET.080.04.2.1]